MRVILSIEFVNNNNKKILKDYCKIYLDEIIIAQSSGVSFYYYSRETNIYYYSLFLKQF